MALPWLIGAAVVGVVSAIAKAVSDDTPSSSSSSDSSAEERRRREEAAQARAERERTEKKAHARQVFAETGAAYGKDLTESLQGWVDVRSEEPCFRSRLNTSGCTVPDVADNGALPVMELLFQAYPRPNADARTTLENLEFYGMLYDVRLKAGTRMRRRAAEIDRIDEQLSQLGNMKKRLRQLEQELAAPGQ